jgi:hypothetical protein
MSVLLLVTVTEHAFVFRRMCKVFENRSLQDEERMDQLTNQLKEARLLAEDADGKSDEVTGIEWGHQFV